MFFWLSPLRFFYFFYYSVGVNRLCAGQSLSFLAKKKVTKESCLGIGESHERYSGLRSASLPSRPRRVIDYRTRKAVARGLGHRRTKSFTLCHRPYSIKHRRTTWTKTHLGALSSAPPICWRWWLIGSRSTGTGRRINPGTRSGAKLYSQTSRTAVFDQTRPMAESEAFGVTMSQISRISFPGAVINDTPRTRGSAAKRSPVVASSYSPLPRQLSFVSFFSARKESDRSARSGSPLRSRKQKNQSEAEITPTQPHADKPYQPTRKESRLRGSLNARRA